MYRRQSQMTWGGSKDPGLELNPFNGPGKKPYKAILLGVGALALLAGAAVLLIPQIQVRANPAKAAEVWTEAVADLNGDRIEGLSCLTAPVSAQAVLQIFSAIEDVAPGDFLPAGQGELLDEILDSLKEQVEIDISRLTYETVNQTEHEAVIHVYGDLVATILRTHFPVPFDQTWIMQREDGVWKWCGWPETP